MAELPGRRHRLGRLRWRQSPEYAGLCARLASPEGGGLSRVQAESCVGLLCHFVRWYAETVPEDDPVEGLECVRTSGAGAQAAREAWQRLADHCGWRPKHVGLARTRLSRALFLVNPTLAFAVNPAMRRPGAADIRYRTHRSQRPQFTLHECLSLTVRHLGVDHPKYQLLVRLGREMGDGMRSVSRDHLRQLFRFLDRLIPDEQTDDVDGWLRRLRALTALDWLARYRQRFFPQLRQPPEAPARHVSFTLFRKEVRWLSALHGDVLQSKKGLVRIPLPRAAGRLGGESVWRSLAGSQTSAYTYTDDEHGACRLHGQLVEEVCALRMAAVRAGPQDEDDAWRPCALTPAEVRRVVLAADGTRERLVIMLLVTTGLRRGGLVRLRCPVATHARDVPKFLSTREKNNSERSVRLSPTVRILLAHWLGMAGHGQQRASSNNCVYVFPGPRGVGHMDVATVNRICARVFARAAVRGPAAHPHAFRHTAIKMLWPGALARRHR